MKAKTALFLCLITTALTAREPSILTVSGQASLSKPADQLHLNIAVVTEGVTAEEALKANSQKMQAVFSTLEAKGLSKKEFSTGQFNVSPVYSPYPKNPPPEWTQHIIGYRVNNSIAVKSSKLAQAGELIDAVTQEGANSIDQISFELKDARLYRQEAITSATTNAMEDAKSLAAAANIELGRILQIQLDNAASPHPSFKAYAANLERSTPIEAGDVSINAKVTIVYEIEH
jgi:uncharacterized protein